MEVQKNAAATAAAFLPLSLTEGLAVGALILGGVYLVGTYQNAVQRTVVLALAMMCALTDSTLNGLVGMVVHHNSLL